MNKHKFKKSKINEGEINPIDHKFYFDKGMEKEKSKELFDALRYFNKAIILDPNNSEYFNRRALTKLKISSQRYFCSAIRDFTNAINYSPREPLYWQNRGFAKANYGKQNYLYTATIDSKIGIFLAFKFKRKTKREVDLLLYKQRIKYENRLRDSIGFYKEYKKPFRNLMFNIDKFFRVDSGFNRVRKNYLNEYYSNDRIRILSNGRYERYETSKKNY